MGERLTERDIMSRVIAEHRDTATTLVGDVMTRDLVTIAPEATILEANSASWTFLTSAALSAEISALGP